MIKYTKLTKGHTVTLQAKTQLATTQINRHGAEWVIQLERPFTTLLLVRSKKHSFKGSYQTMWVNTTNDTNYEITNVA